MRTMVKDYKARENSPWEQTISPLSVIQFLENANQGEGVDIWKFSVDGLTLAKCINFLEDW